MIALGPLGILGALAYAQARQACAPATPASQTREDWVSEQIANYRQSAVPSTTPTTAWGAMPKHRCASCDVAWADEDIDAPQSTCWSCGT